MDYSHTNRLAKLIQLKHDVLAQLRELSHRQSEAIAADEDERLMSILAQKQVLLNQLQRVEVVLEPYRSEDPDARAWPSAEERRRCQVVAERANLLLGELLALEKQAESHLVASRDRTSQELAAAAGALAARQAYASTTSSAHPGLNLLSES